MAISPGKQIFPLSPMQRGILFHGMSAPGSGVYVEHSRFTLEGLDPAAFRQDMDRLLKGLKECPPAEGAERVYFAGQKEFEAEDECQRLGVPVLLKTYDQICEIGAEYGVTHPPLIGQ